MSKLFGEQLKNERLKKGFTAEEVAKACGIARSYITLIETGRRLPGKKHIVKIASALQLKTGIVLNWYLEDVGQKIRKEVYL
ncbi:MAG: hypothetical protein A3C79_03490 [Candidatus Taylorbacteria bacterium RIFCSPHIGHO2_02_FULL_45_28]|uniref:HTH cro/C1-type domain-containing protein n=1 Tax=Candidatus Taylorbacteria bacterium RIFCSPHIGHO2_12_FULL_45_16 TaxID=1802315 RepID=A0A1G2N1C3_9BACT|nr:MAG: hypothetical protein A2830_01205 [Candidatus Taylorbacteria bacterium RIFCSPHIGHO2_01_FULL_44_110]OHA25019.1 MAG: hypothetical protein A3C79_03490 [Candidatus Taylorbacteria bacterium RIFCSPHIGHO2_02_FULL_45_28]OHA29833.1 MAG: hypothetical protein A3F51_03890 [Candidatus Taylorbacteria bacterium RIFCSPHIGHO2_12_FULL_45_16]OHA32779.1 MAG: hypothetical protein A3A23_00770 [Candidatus Taylorbacteria bacterium RIFCSPLOWO2_01_FULL_45_59]OHA39838.1 MAG: hypothetical protein A3I98_03665 [Candi